MFHYVEPKYVGVKLIHDSSEFLNVLSNQQHDMIPPRDGYPAIYRARWISYGNEAGLHWEEFLSGPILLDYEPDYTYVN